MLARLALLSTDAAPSFLRIICRVPWGWARSTPSLSRQPEPQLPTLSNSAWQVGSETSISEHYAGWQHDPFACTAPSPSLTWAGISALCSTGKVEPRSATPSEFGAQNLLSLLRPEGHRATVHNSTQCFLARGGMCADRNRAVPGAEGLLQRYWPR